MKDRDKYKDLFDELRRLEESNVLFNRRTLAENTGYSEGSVGVYIRNKLKNVYVFEDKDGNLYVKNIRQIDFPTFSEFMSQKSKKVKQKSTLFDSLVERSLEAFYNSIVIYNNPLIEYRIESFCILLINAWELLLKARIIELYNEDEIYKNDGKTISLWNALEKVLPNRKDPIRKNIECLNELRDKAVHLLVPDIQSTLSRIFQASIFNFIKLTKHYNYPNPYINQNPGLMTFITDTEDLEFRTINAKYGEVTAEEIRKLKDKVEKNEKELEDDSYIIPIGYKIVLTKKENEGDLKITTSPDGESAMFIKVPKDNNITHPYRSKDVISKVNQYFKEEKINSYSFQGILIKEKIRRTKSNKYYFLIENPETHKYSQELIDLIIHKIESHENYITDAKNQYTQYLKDNKKGT